ncbi:TPA: response regulator [Candidatus Berkelbacteria bacterium]|uniref:Response regulatory domain-containing protein n=1 Tax=Berkelbacteria bacterium GW2011_GWE1_39_12 TaxID=1618337 RepID=A0A0G4B311_9BACT|nr:MAG: hypothetical protein UT28_C0001G0531 [Berkelbacteria bacterium GW2011_GWE1_39_12]HBO60927.1 response regulator [Candidatus Berkelbacteria bacterium]
MAKILIVEDDVTLSKMYQKKLMLAGYAVEASFNGKDAVVKTAEEMPDLVLLDIMLPGIDGFEVVKQLKANKKTASIPIIILTNLGTSEVFIDEAKMLGVQQYLVKYKTSGTELVEKIKEELEIN